MTPWRRCERPHLFAAAAVFGAGSGGGEVGLERGGVARLVAQQAVEDHVDEGAILGTAGVVRIERADVGGGLTDAQDAAGARRG